MRCAISSRAGQVLARGQLIVQSEDGELRLCFRSDRGTLIEGGLVDEHGDLTAASEVLFEQLFKVWGMTDLTLIARANSIERGDRQKLLLAKENIELL